MAPSIFLRYCQPNKPEKRLWSLYLAVISQMTTIWERKKMQRFYKGSISWAMNSLLVSYRVHCVTVSERDEVVWGSCFKHRNNSRVPSPIKVPENPLVVRIPVLWVPLRDFLLSDVYHVINSVLLSWSWIFFHLNISDNVDYWYQDPL